MKKTALIISLALFISCNKGKNDSANNEKQITENLPAAEATATYKKYDIKSGIVTFETSMEMSGMNIKSTKILYFDDYGIKECEEEYETNPATGKETLKNTNFVNEGYHYICSIENKGGIKTKSRGYGVAAPFNMSEASSLKDQQFKKIEDVTICGKSCNGFSMVTPSGNIKMYGWNRITLKTTLENDAAKMKSTTVATKIEENVPVPADKFAVPTDIKIIEQ
jgi:hypothetical protein